MRKFLLGLIVVSMTALFVGCGETPAADDTATPAAGTDITAPTTDATTDAAVSAADAE